MPKHAKKIPPRVKAALRDEVDNPRLEELVGHFFRAAGGAKEVARMLYAEFAAAKAGSMIRQRILDMVMRALRFTNEQSHDAGDLTLLSLEDLEREAGLLLEKQSEGDRAEEAEPSPSRGA